MPAYVEYLNSLPTVHDLVRDAAVGSMPVLYGDADESIEHPRAFVFQPTSAENSFDRVSIADLVGV